MSWRRTDGHMGDHHSECEFGDRTLIDVWRVEVDGCFYYTDSEPTPDECDGAKVAMSKMLKAHFANLREFDGF